VKKIVIVDYGAGNIASIRNMLKKACFDAEYGKDVSTIEKAEKLIIPGVGAFDYGMQQLRSSGLIDILNQKVLVEKIPVLGICLGLQMMTSSSEEGNEKGLSCIDAKTIRFKQNENFSLKIHYMAWNDVLFVKKFFFWKICTKILDFILFILIMCSTINQEIYQEQHTIVVNLHGQLPNKIFLEINSILKKVTNSDFCFLKILTSYSK